MKPDRLINAQQAAEITGLDSKTILAGKCGTDVFTRVRIGKREVRFSFNEVQGWVTRLLEQARAENSAKREVRQKAAIRFTAPSREDVKRIIAPFQQG